MALMTIGKNLSTGDKSAHLGFPRVVKKLAEVIVLKEFERE